MDCIHEMIENQLGMGRFATFELEDVSYYPSEHVQKRIRLAMYGVDGSQKMHEEEKVGLPHVNFSRPLAHTNTSGTFTLFIPIKGEPYGTLDMRSVKHWKRHDINLSIVSPIALAPNRLHNITWGNRCSFYGVDEESSNWSIHCTLPEK